MSNFLRILLDAEEPIFSNTLMRLEKVTGNSGVDARLIADIISNYHSVLKRLGLDIKDTTARELYHALRPTAKSGVAGLLLPGNDYAMYMAPDGIVSLNLIDVIENAHHDLPFGSHSMSVGRAELKKELLKRYIKHARSDENTIREIAATIGLID